MPWTPRHDAFLADLSRRFALALPGLSRTSNVCFEFASLAATVAQEHGLHARQRVGTWLSPHGPVVHAWTEVDGLILHSRQRFTSAAEIEICSPSQDFRPDAASRDLAPLGAG